MTKFQSMEGKVVLITGSTDGIGKEAARQIAHTGATVVITGRNGERVASVISEIKQDANNNNIDGIIADLSELAGMRQVVAQFQKRHQRLDVLVNNVGALFTEHKLTQDGFERTFALNHLSYFTITNMLLDMLKSSNSARIINVSSDVHVGSSINFDDLHGSTNYSPLSAYRQSKLANLLFTYELARRLSGTNITANALHPGIVRSRFGHNNTSLVGRITGVVLGVMQQLRGVDVVDGADTSVYLACSPEVEGVNGHYWYKRQQKSSSQASLNAEDWQRLWHVSEAMIGELV